MQNVAALYSQFDPLRPITLDDEDLYVDWQRALYPAGKDPSSRVVRQYQRHATPERPIALLLAGQSGVGKTTELLRISSRLTLPDRGRRIFVSTLRARAYLDLEDVRTEDLVLQIVRQLAADLSELGMDLAGLGITAVLRSVSEHVMSTRPDSETVHDPLALAFTRKELTIDRAAYRAQWREQMPAIFDLVNEELLPKARTYLKQRGYADIVLIVDDLDKIPRKVLADEGRTNHEALFLPRASSEAAGSASLVGLGCSLLLSVPIELTVREAGERLGRVYSGPPYRLPCVPIRDRTGRRDEDAEQLLIEILRRRAELANIDVAELFTEAELLERVVALSGGNIRSLLAMLTGLLDRVDDLPIDAETVHRYVASRAAGLGRALVPSDHQMLERIPAGDSAVEDPRFFELLRYRDVYGYGDADGGAWYRVNPVLAAIGL